MKVCPLPTCLVEPEPSWSKGAITRGERYRVIASFVDTDGDTHHVEELWTFLGSWFSKFDDDVTLFIRMADRKTFRFSLHWTADTQENVIENIMTYLEHVHG